MILKFYKFGEALSEDGGPMKIFGWEWSGIGWSHIMPDPSFKKVLAALGKADSEVWGTPETLLLWGLCSKFSTKVKLR